MGGSSLLFSSLLLCEAYEVGWDFVIALEQTQQQPHQNLVASHSGEGNYFMHLDILNDNLICLDFSQRLKCLQINLRFWISAVQ